MKKILVACPTINSPFVSADVDILKKHGFDVKIEVDERTGHVIYYWVVFNSMPRVRLRAFNVGFLLNGLVPDMDLPPAIIIPVMNDIIDFYSLEYCKGVIRTYPRSDISDAVKAKVLTIPLGYNKHSEGRIDAPWTETPSLPFRELNWSFYGTAWKDRMDLLKPLDSIGSSRSKFFETWLKIIQIFKCGKLILMQCACG